ncbi:hypothetical protein [Streptomyces carpaticus]|uniref:Class I SAM-dependent methyltransferase n=1 Tax=Streptomyces carpaticus TaxID=285558 RepID=A0ABV4ZI80_9ACTN
MSAPERPAADAVREADPYEASAPFIDPLIAGFWKAVDHELGASPAALRDVPGPVADIGAGSGRGVRITRAALPQSPVLAVEPSAAMRTALFARMTYEVRQEGRPVRAVTATYPWWVVTDEELRAEWASCGLAAGRGESRDAWLWVLTHD